MKKLPEEAVEFQPDALEIKNQRLPFLARYSVWGAFLFLLGALAWSILAKVDVIVTAQGKLVSDQPNVVMKPLERTVIKKIKVKVGDVVKADQELITFDPVFNQVEENRYRAELLALEAQLKRLTAEFQDTPFTADPKNRAEMWQAAIYRQRQEYYRQKLIYYDESIKQLEASRKTKSDTLEKQKERLESMRRIEKMYTDLHKKNVTALKDMLQMSISRMEMEATADQLENNLLEIRHQIQSTISAKQAFVQEWRNELSTEMVKIDRETSSNRQSLERYNQYGSYVSLKAPCDAVVHEIASFSEGSAVREAEALITLIPLNGNIELEAELRPQDVGKVSRGSEARVKLSAYPFQKWGTLEGTVRDISKDTLQKQQRSSAEELSVYYRIRLRLAGRLRSDTVIQMIPGMEATAEIKTGRRRVIEYLIYPLIKSLDEAAREP